MNKKDQGYIVIHRIFDIAEEVDFKIAKKILNKNEYLQEGFSLIEGSRSFIFREPPLRISGGEVSVSLGDENSLKGVLTSKIWNFGAIAINLRIPLDTVDLKKVAEKTSLINNESERLTKFAMETRDKIVDQIKKSLKNPQKQDYFEDYTSVVFKDGDSPKEIIKNPTVSQIITGQKERKLAEVRVKEMMKNPHQATEEDLIVIDWDSCIILRKYSTMYI